MLPMIPVVVGSLGIGAWYAHRRREKLRNPSPQVAAERKVIYQTAISAKGIDAAKLRELAKAFRSVGLSAEATMLEKRAALKEAPPELKEERRQSFKKAMASKDPAAVESVAAAFEELGATGAASDLRKYAEGLRNAIALSSQDPNQ